jgi:ribose transport system substrate-binding protein
MLKVAGKSRLFTVLRQSLGCSVGAAWRRARWAASQALNHRKGFRMSSKGWLWTVLIAALVGAFFYSRSAGSKPAPTARPVIALIVGGPNPYWQTVIHGARQAAKEFNVELKLHVPDAGGSDQTRRLMLIDPAAVDGIAISPLQPEEQTRTISRLASQTNVVTYDNDAPQSLRHCHVGANNYVAGQTCARLIKEALPDGGTIAIFVGDNVRENSRLRIEGIIDELKGAKLDVGSDFKPPAGSIEAGKYTIVGVFLDGNLADKCKENAKQALEKYPDLKGMVTLYGYNAPACLDALSSADKLGKVKVIAFDEYDATLKGIEDGNVFGTVVQDEARYGYEAIRLLAELARSEATDIPLAGSGSSYLPVSTLTRENIAEYRKKSQSPAEPEDARKQKETAAPAA